MRVPDPLTDPDVQLRDRSNPAVAQALDALLALQVRGFARLGTALRLYVRCLEADTTPVDALVLRLVTARLAALDRADARRAAYLADPPEDAPDRVRAPAWLVGELVVLTLLGALAGWLRKRYRAGTST